jgi:hypothetical protein
MPRSTAAHPGDANDPTRTSAQGAACWTYPSAEAGRCQQQHFDTSGQVMVG